MHPSSLFVLAVGFLAQGCFSARVLVQWVLSERARRVLSPSLFWVLSWVGSCLLCLYGWLRDDLPIILGQSVTYYIYLWNLDMKGVWRRLPLLLRAVLLLTPVAAAGFVAGNAGELAARFLHNRQVPPGLLLFGTAGQGLFTLRFVYQWLYSRRQGESRLPSGFWALSLAGACAVGVYGLLRQDAVLIVGQAFGGVAYIRNWILIHHENQPTK